MRGRWTMQYLLIILGLALLAAGILFPLRQLWSARRQATDASPGSAEEITLYATPAEVREACRRADAAASFRLLCPTRLPQREEPCVLDGETITPGRRRCQGSATAALLRRGGRVYGVEIGYSAPDEGRPALNRPARFLHFVLLGGAARIRDGLGDPVGSRKLGGRSGRLYRGTPRGLHQGHLIFVWREGGTRYAASLHSWDSTSEATALLDGLVSTLARPTSRG